MSQEKPKIKKVVEGAYDLSLGISMVVAVLIGIALGIGMKNLFGAPWLLWLGIFWGVSAAILNVYKAYKKQMRSLDELKNDPKYKNYSNIDDDEDDS